MMVMYPVATNTSVGALFMALLLCRARPWPACSVAWPGTARASSITRACRKRVVERLKTFKASAWGLLLIVIVMGGIYSGMFTPTEAAAMSAVYSVRCAGVRLQRHESEADAACAAQLGQHKMAMLLYIITNAVLFSLHHDQREHSAGAGRGCWATACL
ncbi:MAG: TRAP transporter large permease subunit [Rhodoferax sp.]|nr:TRAP transporter large permease subunit [Rhodoferax sp.]